MTSNSNSFRKVLIILAFIGAFMLGSIIKIELTSLVILAAGLLIGYAIGAGKNFRFWKSNVKRK